MRSAAGSERTITSFFGTRLARFSKAELVEKFGGIDLDLKAAFRLRKILRTSCVVRFISWLNYERPPSMVKAELVEKFGGIDLDLKAAFRLRKILRTSCVVRFISWLNYERPPSMVKAELVEKFG
eukprot:CAMPEP_0167764082 /NCGR_PEP_ID=MMETSP0110_2-20121227/13798_1 /TAXON_ID=629695 /ORGANISM="Gymnochlora sp., Strain CCMP2014" /LENGTH=124 /DNA_ID=CAMNT_0007651373 /DNA_START=411 /DNA_END=781 /DNA_ORIENTATION=+